jgi:pimeloyl-ACP methyl ester carboxylesterase
VGSATATATIELDAGRVEYRLDRRGPAYVLICHGGHMRAGLALGEELFADLGYTVLVPSRPGYGHTPLRTGRSPAQFADAAAELCQQLGIGPLAAVVGISGGGPTAVTMAARHPGIVQRLILLGAVGFGPYPDRRTRLGALVVFNAVTEPVTWAGVRLLLRLAPAVGLRLLLRGTSTIPVRELLADLNDEHRATLLRLFAGMRSGSGFLNDLHGAADVTAQVAQLALVIASRQDGGVPFAHAEALVASLPHAELIVSGSRSHFIWFGDDYPAIAETIRQFLARDPTPPHPGERLPRQG